MLTNEFLRTLPMHHIPQQGKANKEIEQKARRLYLDGKCTHDEYYLWYARFLGIRKPLYPTGYTRESVAQCLKTDNNLNNIPLGYWDAMYGSFRRYGSIVGSWSLCETVCIAKALCRADAMGTLEQFMNEKE